MVLVARTPDRATAAAHGHAVCARLAPAVLAVVDNDRGPITPEQPRPARCERA